MKEASCQRVKNSRGCSECKRCEIYITKVCPKAMECGSKTEDEWRPKKADIDKRPFTWREKTLRKIVKLAKVGLT